jgi:hypothetical protein
MTLNVYAPAIRDAIRRGDLDDVRTMLRDAKRFRRQQGDLDKAASVGPSTSFGSSRWRAT